ncbi:MAG: RodZ domain-containing protein [Gammaproteobacteria bacterium]
MADDDEKAQGHFASEPSPGELLRAARREKKLETKEVAAALNVDPWMLDALEHDEYGALGAPVFAKGHLRKYATALGLDADDLMVAYYQRAGTREAPPLIAESIMRVESTQGPRLTWLAPTLGVLALAVVALGIFFYLKPDGAAEPAQAATVAPEKTTSSAARSTTLRLPGATETSVPLTRDEPTPQPAQAVPLETLITPEPKPVVDTIASALPEEPPEQVAPPTPEPVTLATAVPRRDAPATRTGQGTEQVTITLSFRDESWVEVYDNNRTKLLYGMGDPGSVRSIVGSPPLKVFLGKAGEVAVKVDGRDFTIPRISRLGTARFEIDSP